ncbi:hypothetical protein EAG_07919 [Camponotus floridanus]|uniref:Uncharacterized protein n=1 Tax=Camponotus floridanus TaxID=104421 RepID=E2ACI7_CAMFO|nr:hypothetical protein EAG_07919 [Camponotus floridanus]
MRIRSTRTEDRIHGIVMVPSTLGLHKGFALQKIMLHLKRHLDEVYERYKKGEHGARARRENSGSEKNNPEREDVEPLPVAFRRVSLSVLFPPFPPPSLAHSSPRLRACGRIDEFLGVDGRSPGSNTEQNSMRVRCVQHVLLPRRYSEMATSAAVGDAHHFGTRLTRLAQLPLRPLRRARDGKWRDRGGTKRIEEGYGGGYDAEFEDHAATADIEDNAKDDNDERGSLIADEMSVIEEEVEEADFESQGNRRERK